jgi:2-C-methyl-D-erythritol 4-phosphate cytidylyltransferase
MQADRPKQYLSIGGSTIIEHTLNCFLPHPDLLGIVVALSEEDAYWPQLPCAAGPRIRITVGGSERADSVLKGLDKLMQDGAQSDDWVLVHDAARPNLMASDLDLLITTLATDPVGGLLAVPVRDTLKQIGDDGRVVNTPDRSTFWQAYTPQMFRLSELREAIHGALTAGVRITDEASAMEWAGKAPRLVEGRADNLKVTRPEDLQWLARSWDRR